MGVREFERAAAEAATPEVLWAAFDAHFHGTDVNRISYLHLPPMGAPDANRPMIVAEGFPDALIAQYFDERLFRDNPLLDKANVEVEPIYWDQIENLRPLSDREAAFVAQFRAAGLGSGVGIHTYGPNGRAGQCGLGFRPGVQRLPPATLKEFQWVCQLAHLRYCDMLAALHGPPPALSGRETEVLAWVARGKSNETIGEILGISTQR